MIKIRIKEKGGGEQVLTFDRDTVNIGRARGNDIVLPRPNISKRHARIMVMEGEMYVIDLKSTNGTYVNGDRISAPVKVSDQDKIFMGDFMLKVEKFLEEEAIIPDERVSGSDQYYEPPAAPAEIERSAHDAIRFLDDEGSAMPPPPPDEIDEAPAEGADAVDAGIRDELPDDDFLKGSAPATPAAGMPAHVLDDEVADEVAVAAVARTAPPEPDYVPEAGVQAAEGPFDLPPVPAEAAPALDEAAPDEPAQAPAPAVERHDTPSFMQALPEPDLPVALDEPRPGHKDKAGHSPTAVRHAIQREMDGELEQFERDAQVGGRPTVGEMGRVPEPAMPDRGIERRVTDLITRLVDEGLLGSAVAHPDGVEAVREAVRLELGEDLEAGDLELLVHDLVGLGALDTFLSSPTGEVMHAVGAGTLAVTERGRVVDFHDAFASEASFRYVLQRLLARLGVSAGAEAVQRGVLPGGEAVSVYQPGFTGGRPVLRVDRRRSEFRAMHAWVEAGLLDDVMAEFLGAAVMRGDGFLVLGPEPAYRDGLLEALSLFMVSEAPVVVAQDHPLVRPRHAQVLPMARSWAEREWPVAVGEIRRLAPRHLVLPALTAGEVVRWMPLLAECDGRALASASAPGLDAWIERVELRWQLDGAHPTTEALRAGVRQAFRYVVTLKAWPCGTRKVLAIDELVRDTSGLAVKPCFQYKEDRKSPDGRVVGHFEKAVG